MSMKIRGVPPQRKGTATVVDEYVVVSGVKVVRVVGGTVFVHDKNRHRSAAAGGSSQIAVPVKSFQDAVARASAKSVKNDD